MANSRPRDENGRFVTVHDIEPGSQFGRLTVVREKEGGFAKRRFICRCKCGNEKAIRLEGLLRGTAKSCGCLRKETASRVHSTHGKSDTRLYRIWCNMKNRCNNPNVPHYERYGGRGISVCEEWLKFEPFYEWAQDGGYSDDLTIERIDNSGDYEPRNCTWIPMKKQNHNKRDSRMITYKGETKCLKEWTDLLGVSYAMVSQRINKLGWPAKKALETPPGPQGKNRRY